MAPLVAELVSEYKKKKYEIKKRLKDFDSLHKGALKEIFSELCFCLLTPQSNARYCDGAVQELKNTNLLFNGCARAIRRVLAGKSRFHNKKAEYIVAARRNFNKSILNADDVWNVRERLVKKIKGLGYKEASHFLRNIGLGRGMAILDRHILKNLKRYGVIKQIPLSLTAGSYLDIEKKARVFAKKINIPLEELDLLFWSRETGEIFK
jgi:N-glycosylase/DNA lyase